jgi:hypothetical protein
MIDEPEPRRFLPPWSVDEADPKLDRRCIGKFCRFEYLLETRTARSPAAREMLLP